MEIRREAQQPKTCKSCDQCRNRKVRCTMVVVPGEANRCTHCLKRGEICQFKDLKRKLRFQSRDEANTQTYPSPTRRNASEQPQAFSLLPDPVTLATDGAPLFIDQLLDQHPGADSLKDEHPILKQSGQYGTPTHAEIPDLVDGKMPMCGLVTVSSSSLAFWSDDMISSLSKRIGNNRLRELVDVIESKMQERISAQGALPPGKIAFKKPTTSEVVPHDVAREYVDGLYPPHTACRFNRTCAIWLAFSAAQKPKCRRKTLQTNTAITTAYFEHIHPVYPFLDQTEFEKKAFDSRLPQLWAVNPSFSALYHAVLALGCQYRGGGSFDPGKGKAWDLFQVSLGLMADILVPRESLLNLQALVAMSIFATNMCCLQIDEVLLMEATRMALSLRYHKSSNRTADLADQTTCHRTFWVIYAMEKQVCFRNHNTSLIADCDIACPIPKSSDSTFGDYDWLFASIRFGRILSQAYTSLFSVSGSLSTRSHHHAVIDHIQGLMEVWRMSIPEDFRPGKVRMNHNLVGPSARMVFLQTSYNYYALVIALARLRLHIEANEPGQEASREENKKTLMNAAQMILELTRYIDTDAYSPIFTIGIMPLSAVFILLDFVINNPTDPETRTNLSLLDIASGHFSLLERASSGSLLTSYIAEFAHIARQYVREYRDSDSGKDAQSEQAHGNSLGEERQRVGEDSDSVRWSRVPQPAAERQREPCDLHGHELAGTVVNMDAMATLGPFGTHGSNGIGENPGDTRRDTPNSMDSLHCPWPDNVMPCVDTNTISPRLLPGLDLRAFFASGFSDLAGFHVEDGGNFSTDGG